MKGGYEFRRQLQPHWLERLQAAQRDYERARDAATDALTEWRRESIPKPDGLLAFQKASALERETLQEYMRTLEVFRDLIIYDKLPPED